MGIELFERAAEAKGCLLKAELLVDAEGDIGPERGPGYLLTFDVGRILVAADRNHGRLLVRRVESLEEVASISLAPLDEEEPWWRLAGNPLTRAWPSHAGSGAEAAGKVTDLRMQFREDAEGPHIVSLRYDAGAVCVGLHTGEARATE